MIKYLFFIIGITLTILVLIPVSSYIKILILISLYWTYWIIAFIYKKRGDV